MGGVRTGFKRMISRISRYPRILSNNSTGRLDRLAEGIRVAGGKKVCRADLRLLGLGSTFLTPIALTYVTLLLQFIVKETQNVPCGNWVSPVEGDILFSERWSFVCVAGSLWPKAAESLDES
jgi:hypothetical protein